MLNAWVVAVSAAVLLGTEIFACVSAFLLALLQGQPLLLKSMEGLVLLASLWVSFLIARHVLRCEKRLLQEKGS